MHPPRSAVLRYCAIGAGAAVVVALIYVLWIVVGPGPMDFAGGRGAPDKAPGNSTGVPAELAAASLIERGRYLARAADCATCHTAEAGKSFAGGRAFVLPFGTMYSTNITPDRETGIGAYTDADFLRALHEGMARDGSRLYPAMPYAAYTYMSDADALAIKAYLFSLEPLRSRIPSNALRFPFNQRWLMAIWSRLFNPDERFRPDAGRSAEWNRGAYVAEALAHCGECHTPRNLFQALDNRRKFSGTDQAGWHAYNVTSDRNSGVGAWSFDELARFLSSGHAEGHGTAGGPMGEAINLSLRYLTPGDVTALVTYLRTVPAIATAALPAPRTLPAPTSHREGVSARLDPRGKEIFAGACASCHGWSGVSPVNSHATLTGARAVNDPAATNVVQMVLAGSPPPIDHGGAFMPGFGNAYSDAEVAAVSNYVVARFGSKPSGVTAANVRALRRQISK